MEWVQVFSIIAGVGAIVWGFVFLTNRRIDDLKNELKELFKAKLEPLEKEVTNHIPTQIRELKEDNRELKKELKEDNKELKEDIKKILEKLDNLKDTHK